MYCRIAEELFESGFRKVRAVAVNILIVSNCKRLNEYGLT